MYYVIQKNYVRQTHNLILLDVSFIRLFKNITLIINIRKIDSSHNKLTLYY